MVDFLHVSNSIRDQNGDGWWPGFPLVHQFCDHERPPRRRIMLRANDLTYPHRDASFGHSSCKNKSQVNNLIASDFSVRPRPAITANLVLASYFCIVTDRGHSSRVHYFLAASSYSTSNLAIHSQIEILICACVQTLMDLLMYFHRCLSDNCGVKSPDFPK